MVGLEGVEPVYVRDCDLEGRDGEKLTQEARICPFDRKHGTNIKYIDWGVGILSLLP